MHYQQYQNNKSKTVYKQTNKNTNRQIKTGLDGMSPVFAPFWRLKISLPLRISWSRIWTVTLDSGLVVPAWAWGNWSDTCRSRFFHLTTLFSLFYRCLTTTHAFLAAHRRPSDNCLWRLIYLQRTDSVNDLRCFGDGGGGLLCLPCPSKAKLHLVSEELSRGTIHYQFLIGQTVINIF